MDTAADGTVTAPLGEARPRDPAEEARAELELRARLFGPPEPDDAVDGDRYRLVRRIGAGGGGEVYEAWDAELGRRVAIKILHPRREDADDSEASARLLREAQAIARLSHPHVVGVFDVGRCTPAMAKVLGSAASGGVFVVMEYIEGETLRAWGARRPSLREVVRAMVDAGRGLVAAHEQGLVHRDFKPSNVVLGADGRVRVLDFGLARAIGPAEASTGTDPRVLDDLTGPGLALGTPPYMAPEQHLGTTIGPATDQYALCVSLWELATGARPFEGNTARELLEAKLAGPPPPPHDVPKWLDTVMRRGLAPEPDARHASMKALVGALERGLRRRARTIGIASAAIVVLGAASLGAWGRDLQRRSGCADEGVAEVWNEAEAAALHEAFVGSGHPTALDAWSRTRARLDDYTSTLSELREEACVAGNPSAIACFDERVNRVGVAVAIAKEGDRSVVARALELATELPPLTPCIGAAPDMSAPIDPDLESAIVRAEALLVADRVDEAEALVAEALDTAVRSGDHQASARLALVAGGVLDRRSGAGPEQAEGRYRAALVDAERAGRDDIALAALSQLIRVVGSVGGRFAEADRLAEQAQAKLERLGRPPEPAATLAMELGVLRYRQLRNDDALHAYEEALALRRELYGQQHPKVARVEVEIGNVLLRKGEADEARARFSEARVTIEQAFGSEHPALAGCLNGLALAMQAVGDTAASIVLLERSLHIARSSAGPRHDSVAVALSNLGLAHDTLERHADALKSFDEALAIRVELFGTDHVAVARTRSNRATSLRHLGRLAEAEQELRAALATFERTMGPDSPAVGAVTTNLAELLVARDDLPAALELFERAVSIFDARNDLAADGLARARLGMAQLQVRMGQHDAAARGAEQVLADAPSDELAAAARVILAQALATEDAARARDVAAQARAWFRDRGALDRVAEIDAMIATWPATR